MLPSHCSRIVVKLGTKVVTGHAGDFERSRLENIVANLAELVKEKKEVLIVSSGAVGLGRKTLGEHSRSDLCFRQSCAAIGQNLLISEYKDLFAKHGIVVAQVLVTAEDLADRKRYLALRSMLNELLSLKVVPIINENDSISTMELEERGREKTFGDNDKLSALIASKTEADLLILLTDVDGIYDKNPKQDKSAQKIQKIKTLEELSKVGGLGSASEGRGGIDSKLKAVKLASMGGILSVVASGMNENTVADIFKSEESLPGTLISPTGKSTARKKWIGFFSGVEGVVKINSGARKALQESSASLLPVGILEISGEFSKGMVVSIEEGGMEVGRGVVNYSSSDLAKLVGKQSSEIERALGKKGPEEIVHKDRLVVFEEKHT